LYSPEENVRLLPGYLLKSPKPSANGKHDWNERNHIMGKRKKPIRGSWSKEEIGLLKKLFPSSKTREVADQLGRSYKSVAMKASKMRLRKSKKYLKSLGRA